MTKRRKRKKESSGTLTTLFEITFGCMAGAAIAAVWLILKPVSVVDSPRQDADDLPVRHAINYQAGKLGLVRESQMRLKEEAVLQQSEAEVSLSEQEINRWLVTRYGASSTTDVWGSGIEMRPEPPLVRMADEEMQIGLIYSFSGYVGKKNLVLQTTGHFARAGSGRFEFVPTKTYLGSCPLPAGFVSRFVLNAFLSGFELSEELGRAWTGVRNVALSDGRLSLRFGAAAPAPASDPESGGIQTAIPVAETSLLVDVAEGGAEVSSPAEAESPSSPGTTDALAAVPEETGEMTEAAEPIADAELGALEIEAPAEDSVPVEGGTAEEPAEVEETLGTAPTSGEATEVPAEPEPDGFETVVIEADPAETESVGAAPASVPAESN